MPKNVRGSLAVTSKSSPSRPRARIQEAAAPSAADGGQPQGLPDDLALDVQRRGTNGHPDPDLLRALVH